MSSISSAVNLLSSLSLLPANASGAAQKATPAQLTSMAVSNQALLEAEALFGPPATSTSDFATPTDSVSLSNVLLQSLQPGTATSAATSAATSTVTTGTPSQPGINLLA